MDRFVSNFRNRLDAKGRVSIPASFRTVLTRDGFEGLFVHRSLDQPTLDCGGHALLGEIDALLTTLPPHSADRDLFSTALLGTSDVLKVDGEGRVGLPDSLKHHAGITGEVCFVGLGSKFQIWEPDRFRRHLDEAISRVQARRNGNPPATALGARE